MFDTKLKLRYLLSDLKLLTQNSGRSVRNELNNDQLILVDPVDEDVEELSTDWSSKRLTMYDLKKMEEY